MYICIIYIYMYEDIYIYIYHIYICMHINIYIYIFDSSFAFIRGPAALLWTVQGLGRVGSGGGMAVAKDEQRKKQERSKENWR